MLAIMKQTAIAIFPTSFLERCADTLGQLQLGRVPMKHIDVHNLRPLRSIDVTRVFCDPEIVAAWEEDHPKIDGIFGNREFVGGVNPGDRRALYFLIMALKPRNVLEVGTHIGSSTIFIAAALKKLNENGKLTTVDIVDVNDPVRGSWKKIGMHMSPANFAAELGLLDLIRFHKGLSLDFMNTTDQRFDFIFLDGDHKANAVYEELASALPLLCEKGLVLLHDYYPNGKPLYPHCVAMIGPFLALRRIQKENPIIEVVPLGELPWPTKQGTNMTSLALVTKAAQA